MSGDAPSAEPGLHDLGGLPLREGTPRPRQLSSQDRRSNPCRLPTTSSGPHSGWQAYQEALRAFTRPSIGFAPVIIGWCFSGREPASTSSVCSVRATSNAHTDDPCAPAPKPAPPPLPTAYTWCAWINSRSIAGPVAALPGRAQTLSPSQPRRLGCRFFRSARVPCGATRNPHSPVRRLYENRQIIYTVHLHYALLFDARFCC